MYIYIYISKKRLKDDSDDDPLWLEEESYPCPTSCHAQTRRFCAVDARRFGENEKCRIMCYLRLRPFFLFEAAKAFVWCYIEIYCTRALYFYLSIYLSSFCDYYACKYSNRMSGIIKEFFSGRTLSFLPDSLDVTWFRRRRGGTDYRLNQTVFFRTNMQGVE